MLIKIAKIGFRGIRKAKRLAELVLTNVFNKTVRLQRGDPKEIPVIIINFNQLFYLKKLIDFLLERKFKNIIIIDNASTYPPLLDYYKNIKDCVTIHSLNYNGGHMVFFKNDEILKKYSKGYFILTDADIVPNVNCPENFLEKMMKWLDKDVYAIKVGFALKINDIPDYYPLKDKVLKWESQFWKDEIAPEVYRASIDTTFAMYRPNPEYKKWKDFYSGIRLAGNMEAMHGGWYINHQHPTEEYLYYQKTSNESNSWKMNLSGDLDGKDKMNYS